MAKIVMTAGFATAALFLTACGSVSNTPSSATYGPNPVLVAPEKSLIPTFGVPKAVGWPQGRTPQAAPGFQVAKFAGGFEHPRWLYVLPDGDVLVAETNAPPKPEDGKGLRGFVQKLLMKRVGSITPSANRITLLRDQDGDGVAETRTVFLSGLNSPFGMALVGNQFYVADSDALLVADDVGNTIWRVIPAAR
ncbi:MAG: DUF7133 domain-containing protein [Caulobacteraceae bacterium]